MTTERKGESKEDLRVKNKNIITKQRWHLKSEGDSMPFAVGSKEDMKELYDALNQTWQNYSSMHFDSTKKYYTVYVEKFCLDAHIFDCEHTYYICKDPTLAHSLILSDVTATEFSLQKYIQPAPHSSLS